MLYLRQGEKGLYSRGYGGKIYFPHKTLFRDAKPGIVINDKVELDKDKYGFISGEMLNTKELTIDDIFQIAISNKINYDIRLLSDGITTFVMHNYYYGITLIKNKAGELEQFMIAYDTLVYKYGFKEYPIKNILFKEGLHSNTIGNEWNMENLYRLGQCMNSFIDDIRIYKNLALLMHHDKFNKIVDTNVCLLINNHVFCIGGIDDIPDEILNTTKNLYTALKEVLLEIPASSANNAVNILRYNKINSYINIEDESEAVRKALVLGIINIAWYNDDHVLFSYLSLYKIDDFENIFSDDEKKDIYDFISYINDGTDKYISKLSKKGLSASIISQYNWRKELCI